MKTFHSKRDWSLGSLVWGILLAAFVNSSYHIYLNRSERDLVISFVIWIPTMLLVASIWFFTRYQLKEKHLVVRIGPIKHSEIEYRDIKKISRSRNMKAAPANSMVRLRIDFGQMEYILISPRNEDEFLEELLKLAPDAVIEN